MEEIKVKKVIKPIADLLADFFIVLGVVLLLNQYILVVGQVDGASMEMTLVDEERVVIDKLSYSFSDPKRFDIVAVKFPGEPKYWIKRVIGLPGEVIEYRDNKLYINNVYQEEQFLTPGKITDNFSTRKFSPGQNGKIAAGEYLVLGDNRGNSLDGRMRGTLKKAEILGVARISIFPFDRFGPL